MSLSRRNEGNPFYGKHHSEESRKKMSNAQKTRKQLDKNMEVKYDT